MLQDHEAAFKAKMKAERKLIRDRKNILDQGKSDQKKKMAKKKKTKKIKKVLVKKKKPVSNSSIDSHSTTHPSTETPEEGGQLSKLDYEFQSESEFESELEDDEAAEDNSECSCVEEEENISDENDTFEEAPNDDEDNVENAEVDHDEADHDEVDQDEVDSDNIWIRSGSNCAEQNSDSEFECSSMSDTFFYDYFPDRSGKQQNISSQQQPHSDERLYNFDPNHDDDNDVEVVKCIKLLNDI